MQKIPTVNLIRYVRRLMMASVASGVALAQPFPMTSADASRPADGEADQLLKDADQLLKSNRSVLGKVQAVTSDQIKVDVGEINPRFLPLKQLQEKGLSTIKEGEVLIIMLNAQNLLVDFHPLDGVSSSHTIIRGEIAQRLPIGQESAVVKSGGKDQSFIIRSQARSKVAAIPIRVPAVFLIDETNQITDATFTDLRATKEAEQQPERKSPTKGAHQRVDGTVTAPLRGNRITIQTGNGSEKPFEVRELLHRKVAGLRKGDAVILLVDTDNKVIDVAIPPAAR